MMKINCDMGEGFGIYRIGNDEEIMPYIDMANIACGFHASDPTHMQKTVVLALKHHVEIGAHVGYRDLYGFGRREIGWSNDEIKLAVRYQVGALQAIAYAEGGSVSYVKPHGALYHRMMECHDTFVAILEAMAPFEGLKLVAHALCDQEHLLGICARYGVGVMFEFFADRGIGEDGKLLPRGHEGAVLKSLEVVASRYEKILYDKVIKGEDGTRFPLHADTVCVHSDTPNAQKLVRTIKEINQRYIAYE